MGDEGEETEVARGARDLKGEPPTASPRLPRVLIREI